MPSILQSTTLKTLKEARSLIENCITEENSHIPQRGLVCRLLAQCHADVQFLINDLQLAIKYSDYKDKAYMFEETPDGKKVLRSMTMDQIFRLVENAGAVIEDDDIGEVINNVL